tara:strand:- start:645 stop:1748 length:1104 start_codon:yes stop_codon:yes gene_type:complete
MSKPEKDRLDETDVLAAMREERRHLALKFLEKNGAEQDLSNSLGNDASFRTYYRLKEPADALLMDSPAAHEPVEPFVKIAEHLRSLGLSAPEILAKDLENNFLIIEDFGDKTFSRLFAAGHNREELYNLAIDVLVKLHNDVKSSWVRIPEYTIKTFIDETGRTLNWYYPILKGEKPSGALKEKWVAVWGQLFDSLPDIEETLILRDYHCDNLMLIDGEEGLKACGLLDFQDALIGASPYDLVSIIENDRIAVDEDLQKRLVDRYLSARDSDLFDQDAFMKWYRVLGVQRQMKILGLFYRLYIRDGKPSYLAFIPQVIRLIKNGLQDPIMKPIADLIDQEFGELEFFDKDQLDIQQLRQAELNDKLPL